MAYNPFGGDYDQANSGARSTTTLDSFQNKLSYTTPAITATYRIEWSCVVDNTILQGQVRLFNDTDAAVIGVVRLYTLSVASDRLSQGGSGFVVLTGTAKTLIIQWMSTIAGNTQGISNARIDVWRVA